MNDGTKDFFPATAEEPEKTLQRELGGDIVICEAAGEYTLPDYEPEIRKILHIRAAVLPSGKYLSGRSAEFSGAVAHDVLYADAEGKLASVRLHAEYAFSLPYSEGTEPIASADSMADSTVARLGGPRKISLRTRVRSAVHLLAEESPAPDIRGMGSREDTASLEKLTVKVKNSRMIPAASEELSLSSTVRLDTDARDARVIWSGGGMLVSECRPQAGGVICRGEAWMRALLSEGDGIPYAVREKIPFEEFIPIPGLGDSPSFTAYGRILHTDVSIAEGGEEEPGQLIFDATGEIEVAAYTADTAEPIRELYSTSYDMTTAHRELATRRPLGTTSGNYTLSGSRPRSECEAEGAVAVVDADGRTEIHTVTAENGRAVVSGAATVTVIFASLGEGDRPTLLSAEVPIPFRIETDLRPDTKNADFACHAELITARARLDERSLSADAELAITLAASEPTATRILSSAEPDRSIPVEHKNSRIYVVYPKEEDSLFSLGARYHKSRAALARANGLGEELLEKSAIPQSLDGVHHLLVED